VPWCLSEFGQIRTVFAHVNIADPRNGLSLLDEGLCNRFDVLALSEQLVRSFREKNVLFLLELHILNVPVQKSGRFIVAICWVLLPTFIRLRTIP
jgi:hypothetical protein